ncbi:MAG: hypothetical protein HKN16_02935, partial [Saprospiraceae bacterium]|nr:hypothetical protein [Saprospiraceae bacterium]
MKRIFLFSLATVFSLSLFGQHRYYTPDHLVYHEKKISPVLDDGASLELAKPAGPVYQPAIAQSARSLEVQIGETYYDLQTNSSIQNRFNLLPDGDWAASWIMSFETAAHTDRGTGYNSTSGGVWGSEPSSRLESLRCGWPSLTNDTNGNEVALSHATATTPYSLNIMYKADGSSSWTETNYPGDQALGMLWPRTAASGDYLHVIALSTPSGFGGGDLDGIDGTLLYYRSTDGGLTFDMEEVQFPGLDSTFYGSVGPDTYTIFASGSTVAVGLFSGFGDIAIWKSDDNGTSWSKSIAFDFPLDGYSADDGYTFEDVQDFYVDGVSPDSLAVPSTDGSGALVIDLTGKIHMAAGYTYFIDPDLSDGGTNYYPGFGDLWYWN